MKFNPDHLKSGETREIINVLISHVTKTDEEVVEEAKEKKKSTELKVFVAESANFEVGTVDGRLQDLYESGDLSQYAKDFINEHTFAEEVLNEDVSYLEIGTPKYGRTDQFILLNEDGYLRVLTAERRKWTKKTVEKLIQYLPGLDRVFLSPSDIEGMVNEELDGTSLSGFTARYNPYYSEKELSIQFHGGEQENLDEVEEYFNARPSRVEFSQSNSPQEAVKGAVRQDGYYSIPRIRQGSEDVGYDTIVQLSEGYENHDRENFEVSNKQRSSFEDGFTLEGVTTLHLIEEADQDPEVGVTPDGGESSLVELLEEEILDGKRRYKYSTWEEGDFLVLDTETREPFQVVVKGEDIAVHAKPATTATSLREFGQTILDEFNSTYRFEKFSKSLSA